MTSLAPLGSENVSMSSLAQFRILFMRDLRGGFRNPLVVYGLPIVLPIACQVLVAKVLSRVTELPGYPTHNYAEWITPAVIMITAMVSSGYAATTLVIDIHSGFVDRLRLLDVSPAALLISRMLFDVLRVLLGGVAVLIVGVVLGTRLNGGVVSIVILFILLTIWATAYGGLFFVVGLRTRNPQAPLAVAPVGIPLHFITTLYCPRSLLPPWAQAVSRWNPFTYMIDASRALTTGPPSDQTVIRAVEVAVVLLVVSVLASLRALSHAVDAI